MIAAGGVLLSVRRLHNSRGLPMLKSFGIAIATSLVLCPIASASSMEKFEVDIVYNGDLLETEEGTEVVLASIEDQAKEACTTVPTYWNESIVDRECVKDVTRKAIAKIKTVEATKGRSLSTDFAGLDPVAQSAGQR